jgi:hypothetical protein
VRIEPREVQVGGEARAEPHEAEDDVLDAVAHVGLAAGVHLVGFLARQVQHDRDVVGAEGPQRVLVGAQLPEIQAVAVDVAQVAELTRVGDLLEAVEARVELKQVPDHEHPPRPFLGLHGPLGVRDRLGQRLLHEAVLAGLEHSGRELGVGRDGGREHDRVELGVGEKVLDVAGELRAAEDAGEALARLRPAVAAPAQLRAGETVEVSSEVRPPVAEADDADRDRGALHRSTALVVRAAWRVTPRRSTTSGARSSIAS